MAGLLVKKVVGEPTQPYSPSTIYIQGDTLPVVATGWRVNILTTTGPYPVLDEVEIGDVPHDEGLLFFTEEVAVVDHLAIYAFNGVRHSGDYWKSDSHACKIGKIYSSAKSVSDVRLYAHYFEDRRPDHVKIEYSNDSTNGANGTWTTFVEKLSTDYINDESSFTQFAGTISISVSSSDGTKLYKGLTQTELDTLVNAGSHAVTVDDITGRDALGLTDDNFVYVADASADPIVSTGGALYFYSNALDTFTNLSVAPEAGILSSEQW